MRLSLVEIARIVDSPAPDQDADVTGLCVDSRKCLPGDLFCAVEGSKVDGHAYVSEAISASAAGVMVTKSVDVLFPTIRVSDIPQALSRIASHIRAGFRGEVVGVTGSVGKSSCKELIAAGLGSAGPTLKSEGNQNTEYGLPMSWFQLAPEHRFAVMEMGMRGKGHIAHLCAFSKPNIGVITAIGTAHIGELGSHRAIAEAKGELIEALPQDGVAVLPADSEFLMELTSRAKCRVITFGVSPDADIRVLEAKVDFTRNCTDSVFELKGDRISASVPGLGIHQAVNASAAIAVCLALDVPVESAIRAMERAQILGNRLQSVYHNEALILLDVYNSSPESCIESLHALADAPCSGQRIAILGDMLELGDFSEEGHRLVGAEAARLGLDRLSIIGRVSHWIAEEAAEAGFTGRVDHLGTLEQAASVLKKLAPGDVALIKGSRGLQLEKAVEMAGVHVV